METNGMKESITVDKIWLKSYRRQPADYPDAYQSLVEIFANSATLPTFLHSIIWVPPSLTATVNIARLCCVLAKILN